MFINNKPVKFRNNFFENIKDILVELNDKYTRLLPNFVYEIQQAGNQAVIPEINTMDGLNGWARAAERTSGQADKINVNEVRPLAAFK